MAIPAIIAAIVQALKAAGGAISGAGGVSGGASSGAGGASSGMPKIVQAAIQGGGQTSQPANNQQQQASSISDLFSAVGNVAGGAVNAVGNVAGGAVNAAGGVINTAGDVAGGAMDFLGMPLRDKEGNYPASSFKGQRQLRSQLSARKQNVNELLRVVKSPNFSDDDKERAARKFFQITMPGEYDRKLSQNPDIKFYNPSIATDSMVKGVIDLGKIRGAKNKFDYKDEEGNVVSDITPETAAFFDAAEKYVKDRVGFKEPAINPKTGKPRRIFDKSGKVIGTRNVEGTATTPKGKIVDNRELFSGGVNAFGDVKKSAPADGQVKDISEYLQAATEVVPQEKIPKTFEQLGITNASDQVTLKEMQDSLPDIDLQQEYEDDPERMQALMKLWREKKIDKKQLLKAFSMLQQKAKQSLRIA